MSPHTTNVSRRTDVASNTGPATATYTTDVRTSGSATPAWLYSDPYQGIDAELRATAPRTSRHSVTPISPTAAAARGPPKIAAANRGAIVRLIRVPPGTRTGAAPAINVTPTQNASPIGPPICACRGYATTAAAEAAAANAITANSRSR